jgi:hypothetical protein
MPKPIAAPGEQEIEQQTRDLAGCPQCGARRGRACYPLRHEKTPNRFAWSPAAHTGRLRLALQHPAWRGTRPNLDLRPECQICAVGQPLGLHMKAVLLAKSQP